MPINETLGSIGNWISINITQKVIVWISSQGVSISEFSSKIISLIIILLLVYLVAVIFKNLRTVLKIGIIILLILLGVSIFFSF
jgi:hypothetical protein